MFANFPKISSVLNSWISIYIRTVPIKYPANAVENVKACRAFAKDKIIEELILYETLRRPSDFVLNLPTVFANTFPNIHQQYWRIYANAIIGLQCFRWYSLPYPIVKPFEKYSSRELTQIFIKETSSEVDSDNKIPSIF